MRRDLVADECDLIGVNERLDVGKGVEDGELVLPAHNLVREQLAVCLEVVESDEAHIELQGCNLLDGRLKALYGGAVLLLLCLERFEVVLVVTVPEAPQHNKQRHPGQAADNRDDEATSSGS